jgi:hypothetical protein
MRKPIKGQCYENNFRHLMGRHERGESVRGWRLCHGLAIGKGPIEGVVFGHSWLEYNDRETGRRVLDASCGKDMSQAVYYMSGEIGTVIRYTYEYACRLAVRHGTYGPWHPAIQRAAHVTRRRRKND